MKPITTWHIPADHPAFAGHFPGTPMLPGVALLDAVLHTLAAAAGFAPEHCEIRSAKFFNPARPGDDLVIQHAPAGNGTQRFTITTADGARKIAAGLIAAPVPTMSA